jgi:hypothetical protein
METLFWRCVPSRRRLLEGTTDPVRKGRGDEKTAEVATQTLDVAPTEFSASSTAEWFSPSGETSATASASESSSTAGVGSPSTLRDTSKEDHHGKQIRMLNRSHRICSNNLQ